jgi:hypothetical protein
MQKYVFLGINFNSISIFPGVVSVKADRMCLIRHFLLWGSIITEAIFGHDCLPKRLIEFINNKRTPVFVLTAIKKENWMVSLIHFSFIMQYIYNLLFNCDILFKKGIDTTSYMYFMGLQCANSFISDTFRNDAVSLSFIIP